MRRSQWRFDERVADKHVYLVLAGGDNPRLKASGLVTQFFWMADFLRMVFSGYVIGEGNQPGDRRRDQAALAQARALNRAIHGCRQGAGT